LIQAAHRTSAEQYRAVMAANADAAFFVLSRWANAMRESQQPGSAVLFSSVVARIGVANHEAIAAAKGAIEAMARSFAATYAPQRLRFNVLAPGMTDTPMTAAMLRSDAVREGAAKQYPLGSIGTASELAQMAAYLVSESAQRITGQIIAVDGGFTAVRPLVR
jgi:NAD(P)-dependent dehydrogenase (short-subunit alcohol dehydrogenase family)